MKGGISKKALAVWEIGLALLAAVLVVLVLVIFYPRTWIWYALLWIIGFAYVFFSFLYLPLLHLSCQYETTDEYVEYRGGLVFHSRKQMLRRSIMYVTLIRTPVSYLLRTRSIVINSMGGQLTIPWIPLKQAEQLLNDITPRHPAQKGRIVQENPPEENQEMQP